MKKIIQDLSYSELEDYILSIKEPKFRAKQIYEGLTLGKNIDELSNISANLKEKLKIDFEETTLSIYLAKKSEIDNTEKFLYKLSDGNIIEGVLMQYKYGYTLCVSTQIGCRMGCKFCASTLNGLIRNLTAGEILSQVLCVNRMLGGTLKNRKITNVVLMGSGEPLDNYDNVIKFLKLISTKEGINISPRNISISTCGIVENMYKLADEELDITLTISLHASNDEIRKQTMPIANKYSIGQIIDAAKYYFNKTGRRIIFEYALIKDINDNKESADELSKILRGFPCHVNLIPLNPVKERNLNSTSRKFAYQFCQMLNDLKISATVRRTMGEDIDGACGQLRNNHLN